MQIDDRALQFLTAAKQSGKSKEEAFAFLQSKGYDLGSYQPQQPQAMQEQPTQKRQYTPLEKVAYTLRGAGEGLGFELGDVVGGITNTVAAPIGKTVGAITEGNPLSFSDFNPWQNFKQGRKDFVREQKQFADTHPWLNGIGEFGGAAVTGVLGAGKKLATAAGKQGLKALANQGAKEGFKWGGIYSAGAGATKDPNKISLQDALIEGPIGAGTGAVLGAALPVATVGATRGAQQFFGTKGYAKRAADKIFQKAGSKNIDDIVRTTEGTRALKEAIKADDAVAEQVRNVADKAIINGAEKTQRTVEKTLGVGDIVRARDNAKTAYNDLIKQSEAKIPQGMYQNRALQEALAQAKKNDYLGEIAQFGNDSLFTAQRTKENLDDMIEASFETGDFGKKVATDKTRQLMKIKDQFVRGLDQLEPAYKGIRKNFEDSTQAFNLLEELTKARGGERSNTINQILTNKNKGLISKIYGKEKADSLFNALRDQKVETDRFSKLYNAAENKLTKEQAKSQGLVREALESFGSIVGNAIDTARLGGATRGRRRIGEILLGMNKETKNPGFTSSIANKLKEEGGYAMMDPERSKAFREAYQKEFQERLGKTKPIVSELNSLGKPVAKTEEAAKNFKKWFGNSKVVDKEGRPLVLADNEQIYIMDGMTNEGFRKYTYQDAHRAPSFDDTPIAERMELGGDYNLKEIAKGFSPAPEDYFSINGPRYYMYDTPTGHESFNAIREILNGNKKKITAYRAVPKDVLSNDFDNGSWITFSKKYAEQHGNNRFDGNYRIVKKEVPIENVWWDGNDINEWGFDNGKGRIKDLFVKIENPKYQDNIPTSGAEATQLVKEGFDGVITPDGKYFVMGKNQIKSTKNQGTFDPKNPNIYKSLIGGIGISQILRNKGEQNGIRQ